MSKDDQFRQYAGGGASGRSIQNRKALATATRAHARACGEHYSKQNRTRLSEMARGNILPATHGQL